MPQLVPGWVGNDVGNPGSSSGLGRNAALVRLVQAGSALPPTLNPRLAASGPYVSLVPVAGISTVLWVQVEMFMRSRASEKGHKHFFFYCIFNEVEKSGQ